MVGRDHVDGLLGLLQSSHLHGGCKEDEHGTLAGASAARLKDENRAGGYLMHPTRALRRTFEL